MSIPLAILLAILGAAGLCIISWRGMKNSANITNPFPELPDDIFRKCAVNIRKRYTFFFVCCLMILVSFVFFYAASSGAGKGSYLLGLIGIFLALLFLALGSFERRKVEEILEKHKHNWKDLTESIAAHKA